MLGSTVQTDKGKKGRISPQKIEVNGKKIGFLEGILDLYTKARLMSRCVISSSTYRWPPIQLWVCGETRSVLLRRLTVYRHLVPSVCTEANLL